MSEPTRILKEGGDDFERALLASARADKGSGTALRRALAALSAAAIVGTGSVGAAASSGAAITAISIAKWAGVGALIGGVGMSATSAAIHYSRPAQSPAQTSVAKAPARSRPTVLAPAATPRVPVEEPQVAPAPEPLSPAVEPASPAPRPAASPSTDRESKLAEELSLLREARAALVGKQPEAALLLLQRYERSFSHAALGPEAALLRLEALTESGQVEAAHSLSERLLRAAPTSPYADRVRALSSRSR